MNHLLNPINWSTYIESSILLLVIYYGWIGWKYYRPEINQIIARISGKPSDSNELPAALQYTGEEQAEHDVRTDHAIGSPDRADEKERAGLINALKNLISSAQDKPYHPATLIPQLKKLVNEHTELAIFPHREAINELIVQECEKTGTALLSEGEVDLWWDA